MNCRPIVAANFILRSTLSVIVFKSSVALVLACRLMTAYAADSDEEKLSKAATVKGDRLEKEIRSEIKSLGMHQWAGEYYWGNGLGANVSFSIAPRRGYVFRWTGCLGLYDQNYGTVTSTNGELHLSFTYKNERKGFQGIAQQFIPVSWGRRKYLIPSDDVIGFCNQINEGSEPRNSMWGSYLLRKGDEKQKVSGFPNVPTPYRPYLLTQPIESEITTIGSSTTRPSVVEWKFIDTTVILNSGRQQGLLPGMELLVIQPPNLVQSVRLTRVDDDRSEAVWIQAGEDEPGPKVGMRLSTKAPWRQEAQRTADE